MGSPGAPRVHRELRRRRLCPGSRSRRGGRAVLVARRDATARRFLRAGEGALRIALRTGEPARLGARTHAGDTGTAWLIIPFPLSRRDRIQEVDMERVDILIEPVRA